MRRLLLVIITTFSGCAGPGDHPTSPNCEWIESDHRWADQQFGHRPEWDQQCQKCMETLFTGVANTHGVDVAAVRQSSRERDAVVAYSFAGRIRKRFPPGEPGFWVMALTMAAGVSLAGVLIGIFGSIIVETLRRLYPLCWCRDHLPGRFVAPLLPDAAPIPHSIDFGMVVFPRSPRVNN